MDKQLLSKETIDILEYRIQQEEIGKSITIIDIIKLTSDMLVLDGYIGEKYL